MSTNSRLYYALIACIGAIACFWFVSVGIIDQYRFAQHGVLTEIYPVSTTYTQTIRNKGGTTYKMDVAYHHQNGKEILLRHHKLSAADLNNLAQSISVRREYLPDAPLKTRVPSDNAIARLSVLLIFGFLLLIFGGLELLRIKKFTHFQQQA